MSLSGSKSPIREVIKGLCAHLLANVEPLEQAIDEWPSYNQKLTMPAVSIFAKTPKFMPVQQYTIYKSAASGSDDDRVATVRKVIGTYDLELQLDLWCEYKPQRDSVWADISGAFSLIPDIHGVNLTLTNYFDESVHFSIDTVQYVEDETESQRNEWRVMAKILLSVRVIQETTGRIIETIENTLETPEGIDALSEDETALII